MSYQLQICYAGHNEIIHKSGKCPLCEALAVIEVEDNKKKGDAMKAEGKGE